MELSESVRDFLAYVGSERALAANTRIAYEKDLEQFLEFCSLRQFAAETANLKQLRDFIASLRRRYLAPRSIARKISALKQFYLFLMREERIETNPSELLTILVKTKRLPKHLTVDEMFGLIAAAKGEDEAGIRDRAMLEMWYATGCRVSELASVQISDIDWEQAVIKLRGKGGRERLVPLHPVSLDWASRYRAIRHQWLLRFELAEMDAFFLTRQGKAFSRQGIWKIVKKYAEQAGIRRNVWPHMIRHSFATHCLRNGADLRAVQELLGHRSIATTEIYTHLDIENLKTMQQKYHPRG